MIGHLRAAGARGLEVVEKHERLHELAEVARAHEAGDGAVRVPRGQLDDTPPARSRGADRGRNHGVTSPRRAHATTPARTRRTPGAVGALCRMKRCVITAPTMTMDRSAAPKNFVRGTISGLPRSLPEAAPTKAKARRACRTQSAMFAPLRRGRRVGAAAGVIAD